MNWKLRLQNKTTLTAIIFAVISIIYKILNLAGVTPEIAQGAIEDIAELVIFLLCLLGIVVDPTTNGVTDSERAMGYEFPYKDEDEEADEEEEA